MKSKQIHDPPILFVGIDWADQFHVAALLVVQQNSPTEQRTPTESFQQEPAAIADWVASLKERFPQHRILIALEQSRGPLIAGLAGFAELELYPINPRQLASYRDALFPSRSKNDLDDAQLLARFLKEHQQHLRAWQPDDARTRQIAELTELRRKLVEQRKCAVLQLKSLLKGSFPLLLTLSRRELHNTLTLDLLRRWPQLRQLKRVRPVTLRKFLAEHGIKNADQQTEFIDAVRSATPLTTDDALVAPQALYAQALAEQLRALNIAISQFDERLQQLTVAHPDHDLFRSLPGAGDALVPRLIAAFGSDRQRYQNAEEVQCYSGIAPITKQSGQSKHVNKRLACPKFLRQTFHEFADHARKWSRWSKAFYKMKRAAGMKHNAAIRALAYKWIRILFRIWKTREPYCEQRYLAQLTKKNSPLTKFLPTGKNL